MPARFVPLQPVKASRLMDGKPCVRTMHNRLVATIDIPDNVAQYGATPEAYALLFARSPELLAHARNVLDNCFGFPEGTKHHWDALHTLIEEIDRGVL